MTGVQTCALPIFTGVQAAVVDGKLQLFADSTTVNGDSTDVGGAIEIRTVSGSALATLGITAGTYINPDFHSSDHTLIPDWYADDPVPRPTGCVWRKRTAVNEGTNLVLKQYLTGSASWNKVAVQQHGDDVEYIYENDATVTSNYTITTNKNAMSQGPLTINNGVVVTVPNNSVWTVFVTA